MDASQADGADGNAANGDRQDNIINNVDRDLGNANQRRNNGARNHLNPRDRLFYALFMKVGQFYCRLVPRKLRILLEIVVLLKGLLLFSFLTYLHFSFGKVPMDCLNTTAGSWPRDGILRVQIDFNYTIQNQLPSFYSPQQNKVIFHPCHYEKYVDAKTCESMNSGLKSYFAYHEKQYDLNGQCYRLNLSAFLHVHSPRTWKNFNSFEYVSMDEAGNPFQGFKQGEMIKEYRLPAYYQKYFKLTEPDRLYIFEYAQEFGFLRISQEARNRLKIPVKVISFDPNKEKCFGASFNRFILKYFLGYDDVLMNSIKKIADSENNTGYMLNVVTGDHYKFISWGMGRSSYIISLLLMFLFTISISTLLRYCHQQVFFFIIHVLQMMDMNVVLAFPIAPLFTVILSLVGMETIMSEYFNDTTTSFYIILIVWAVDQFDTICCHTVISQKYWLRFFYLYHFIFYSYHYRFNGQYSSIALAATWFLIQHSMLYFLHNYELPAIENGNENGQRDEDAYLDEAVQMIVEGIEMVAGQHNHVNPPDGVHIDNGNGAGNNLANNDDGVEEEDPEEALLYMFYRVFIFTSDTFRELGRILRGRLLFGRRNSSFQYRRVPIVTVNTNGTSEQARVEESSESSSSTISESDEGNVSVQSEPETQLEQLDTELTSLQCECCGGNVEQTVPTPLDVREDGKTADSPIPDEGASNCDKFAITEAEDNLMISTESDDVIKNYHTCDDNECTSVVLPSEDLLARQPGSEGNANKNMK